MATPTRSAFDPLSELEAGFHGTLRTSRPERLRGRARALERHDRQAPRAVARCSDVEDVARAVDFARRHGWPLAVRGGGHNVAGLATSEGGLVLDLSAMNGVEVDPETQTGARARRRHLAGRRRGDAAIRACRTGRAGVGDRRRRPHPRRRHRLAAAQVRPELRQPRGGRGRHRRRRARAARASGRTPSCSGPCAAAAATSAS